MLHALLFPYRARYIGWLIFIPAAVLGMATLADDFEFSFLTLSVPKFLLLTEAFSGKEGVSFVNFTNELAALSIIAGLFLVAFSRERIRAYRR